jgi:hypothetical protein
MRDAIKDSNAYASGIAGAASLGKNTILYPETDLAQQLKNVALMISGGMKTKVYVVTQDFFDTHANQVDPTNKTLGLHSKLLKTASDAIHAFQLDLKTQGLEKRVIGVSLSEFGRQIKSNASNGTDHGTAAPLFLFGACVKPQVLGKNPEIAAVIADQEGVPMQHDFRDVYGSILEDWFGADISIVKDVFYTGFKHLDLIAPDCKIITPTAPPPVPQTNFKVYPNPATSNSTIEFTLKEEEFIHISIVDARGNQLKVFASKVMTPGRHQINLDLSSYLPGHYFVRIVSDRNGTQSRSILKL